MCPFQVGGVYMVYSLQGIVFKIPNVDRYPLDLYGLFKVSETSHVSDVNANIYTQF